MSDNIKKDDKKLLNEELFKDKLISLEQEKITLKSELSQSKEWKSSLLYMLDATPDGILLASADGLIKHGNKNISGLFGYESLSDIVGKNILEFINTEGQKVLSEQLIPRLREYGRWSGEIPVSKADGTSFVAFADCAFINDEKGKPNALVASFKDISMQVQLEAQLRQAQKMEAIGTLAGGIAHDMNNVLSAIFNLATLLKLDSESLSYGHRQDIEDIIYAAKRGRDLSRDLLGFARKGQFLRQRLDLNELVSEVQQLLARTVRNVDLQLMLYDALPDIEGDHSQLSHALMNICLNAVDAIGDSGTIIISTQSVKIDGIDLLAWPQLSAGRYVKLDIIDNGEGMDKDVLEHVFEPFFSTKGSERGTGLGLSMVYGTVTSHGGAISIKSDKGVGTKITILFPLSRNKNTPFRNTASFKMPSQEAYGEILLVDDELMIRRSAARLLSRIGYTVVSAANGVEALEIVEQKVGTLRLIILDLIMPIMDGETTYEHLRNRYPQIPVLISSGFAKGEKVDELIKNGACGFVQKPFELHTIASEIARFVRSV